MSSSRWTAALAVPVLLLALAAPTAQQGDAETQPVEPSGEPQSEGAEPPRFRAEANFVRVDAYVTQNGVAVGDLNAEDFEVFEDGVPQKVETFEYVHIQGWASQEARREPQSAAEGRAMAEDPRARVFVIFLDTYHTDIASSHRMRQPLVSFLNRVIGPDDLVAVMTPEMSARSISLARRTASIEDMLSRHWWGRRDALTLKMDPEERMYEVCYPELGRRIHTEKEARQAQRRCGERVQPIDMYKGVAAEMINRRREKRTLDALDDLAMYLDGLREERKAVLTVSDGWTLYRPNPNLARIGDCDSPPGVTTLGAGPDGGLTADLRRARGAASGATCERDRQLLAGLDNWRSFRDLLDRANRANVSFYPIDSRGLPAGDVPIEHLAKYGEFSVSVSDDRSNLRQRTASLRTLAEETDGLAVVDSNNIERGMRRIIDDLTSYYLLGYYSGNDKLDGKFRSITVKVTRPGIEVRARRGYAPPTRKEVERASQISAAAATVGPSAVEMALAGLSTLRKDRRLFTHVSWMAPVDASGGSGQLWVTGEVDSVTARSSDWAAGGTADVIVTADRDGETIASARQPIAPAARVVSLTVPDVRLAPGDYTVQVRLGSRSPGAALLDRVTFTVPEAGGGIGPPRVQRRGPTTGAAYEPTANLAFRRTDRIRLELPVSGSALRVEAELLDRNGKTMPVPVEATLRPDADGALTWATAEVVLAPLAPGDYVIRTTIEQANRRQEVLAAFRMVP
jgi:VWFA-related protein